MVGPIISGSPQKNLNSLTNSNNSTKKNITTEIFEEKKNSTLQLRPLPVIKPLVDINTPPDYDPPEFPGLNTNNKAQADELSNNEKWQQLKERADLNALDPTSKEINDKVKAEAEKQGYTYDYESKLYIKNTLGKTFQDFVEELEKSHKETWKVESRKIVETSQKILKDQEKEDKALAEKLEIEFKFLSELEKVRDEAKSLNLIAKLQQNEKIEATLKLAIDEKIAKDLQDEQNAQRQPAPILSQRCIDQLKEFGWVLDFQTNLGIDSFGDTHSFNYIRSKFPQ